MRMHTQTCSRGQHCCATLRRGHRTIEMSRLVAPKFDRFHTIRNKCQQVPTLLWFHANGRNILSPTMLRIVGHQCCVLLANNVASVCIGRYSYKTDTNWVAIFMKLQQRHKTCFCDLFRIAHLILAAQYLIQSQ